MIKRNYADPLYKKFRKEVRKRDKRMCKWPYCHKTKTLHVHHILPWAKFPLLRYELANGITLCKKHHKMITGNEMAYAQFFQSLI